jgi:hypothetical protein
VKRAKKKSDFDGEKKNTQLESAKSTLLEGVNRVMKSEPNKLNKKKKKKFSTQGE